ncbi:MAG: hypothetical protein ACRDDY_03065 [Clostridium sp.]|uniref:hypothetical protein n=1 Tax=Clostridium sp. TaxID=1506 RepID=UPI003EE5E231
MKNIEIGTFLHSKEEYNFTEFYASRKLDSDEIEVFENILVDCGFEFSRNKFNEEHFIFDDYENNPYTLEDLLYIWFDNEYDNFKEFFSDKLETLNNLKSKLSL